MRRKQLDRVAAHPKLPAEEAVVVGAGTAARQEPTNSLLRLIRLPTASDCVIAE